MTFHIERNDHACTLRIDGEMTIYSAAEHKAQLLDHLDGCEELELDLSGVGEMDSAGLQVLLVLKREIERSGRKSSNVTKLSLQESQRMRESVYRYAQFQGPITNRNLVTAISSSSTSAVDRRDTPPKKG